MVACDTPIAMDAMQHQRLSQAQQNSPANYSHCADLPFLSRNCVLTTMRYLDVVASTHLESYDTSTAVMGAPRPGMLVFAIVSVVLLNSRILPSSLPTTT